MKLSYIFIFVCIINSVTSYSCPSCIGKLDNEQTPPFFNQEFYQPTSSTNVPAPLSTLVDEFEEILGEKLEANQE